MQKAIVWFRQDLRLRDNPALYYAALENAAIMPVYILDDNSSESLGNAQQWWLHHSLVALQQQFKQAGLHLILKKGNATQWLSDLCQQHKITQVYYNNCYEPKLIEQQNTLKQQLTTQNIVIKTYQSHLLHQPNTLLNKQGSYFKKFSAFWKACCLQSIDKPLTQKPAFKKGITANSDQLSAWQLRPTHPNWAIGFAKYWTAGELAAQQQLRYFLKHLLNNYPIQRNFPADSGTSQLSPHLHFGEISIRQIWYAVKTIEIMQPESSQACERFLKQLGWREFSYHLLYHFPQFATQNFQQKFDYAQWNNDQILLSAWQKGHTGYPLVDAGMRQLRHSGFMHNRVRMIAASFLTKHLQIDWRLGAKWFWETLLDADLANNAMGWQWVVGSGVDSAPYYRIFSPILQGKRFDPQGLYIRQWLPELTKLPNRYIHQPWQAPAEVLTNADLILGKDYPYPIVDHDTARKSALLHYKQLKGLASLVKVNEAEFID